jgi:eukaryotic-like serine/threonine-protein kinase
VTERVISHYKLLEIIGEGGMGVVYKAEDLRLGRLVAIKLLAPGAIAAPEQKARFIQEARTAAALDHPNICTVYEIDEAAGETFIAMAHLVGQSVKDRVRQGVVPISEAVELAIQAAEGMAFAHAHGVVHRDIKSANLFITNQGVLKIIDFGLATVLGQATMTVDAATLGTIAYMSPEQANGERIDPRTDIWSLGVVLYEMIAGELPFTGQRELSTIYAILHNRPKPLRALRDVVPPELETLVSRALSKSKEDRYSNMGELLQSLRALREWTPSAQLTSPLAPAVARLPSIAVLPFADMSSGRDQEYLCEGIAEDIINALMQVQGLQVVARGSSFRFAGRAYDLLDIAQKLRVSTVLEGSVRRQGERLRIAAHLIDVYGGYRLWARRFDVEMKDVFAIQDEISLAIANALKVTLVNKQQDGLVKRYTENLDAYAAYLKGRYFWSKRTPDAVKKAVEFYQEALRQDPDYALAHAGLADAFIQPGYYGTASPHEVMPKGKKAALRALEADPTLAEGRTSLAAIHALYEHDWTSAECQFKMAIQSNPNYATAHSWYSLFVLVPQQRFEEAIARVKIAQRLDPLTPFVNTIVGMCHYFRRAFSAAVEELRRVIDLDPEFPTAHLFLGRALWDSGRRTDAIQAFQKGAVLYPKNAMFTAHLAHAVTSVHGSDDASRMLADLKTECAATYVPGTSLAMLELAIGNKHAAIEMLELAYEQRYLYAIWMAVDPLYDEIRSEPAFSRLMQKLQCEKRLGAQAT